MSEPAQTVKIGQRAASGAVLMVGARLLTRFIDLGSMLVLTRILRPADFGLVAIAASLTALVEAIFELPLNQALLRLPAIQPRHYDTAFTIGLIRGLILMAILVGVSIPIGHFYNDMRLVPLVCFLSLSPFMRGVISPRLADFQKKLSFWRDFTIEISGKGISFIIGTAIAIYTHSYWAIACNSVLYSGTMMIQSYYFAPYRPRLCLAEIELFYEFAGWITASQILSAINWQFERLLFGKMQSKAAVGLFASASDITNIPFLALFGPMARPLLAAFSHLIGDRARLAASYQKASSAMVAVGLPVLIGESLVAEQSVRLIGGPAWAAATPMVRWLALSLTPGLFTLPAFSLLMAVGRTKVLLTRNILELCVKIPLMSIGIIWAGFWGVVGARFASELAADIFSLFVVRSITGITIRRQFTGWQRSGAATALMAIVVEFVKAYVPPSDSLLHAAIGLVLCGMAGALTYAGATFVLWHCSGRADGVEKMLLDRLPRRRSADQTVG